MAVTSRPGDILYWKLAKSRNFPFGHAGIVWNGAGDPYCIEVCGTIVKTRVSDLNPEPHRVFQCDNGLLALEASSVANVWATKTRNPNDPRQAGLTGGRATITGSMRANDGNYGTVTSILSPISRANFGYFARRRARTYRQYKNNIDGPPSFHGLGSQLFCSMFVVAAYVGASANDRECETYMSLDAKNTSPLELANYLHSNNHWERGDFSDY